MAPDIITLTEPASGARARIAPAVGFNCFSLTVPSDPGELELLWSAADFAAGTAKPSSSGIPLMFPFAGRIRGAKYRHDGKAYELEPGDGLGNAIHGFVINRPWRVTRREANRAVGEFQASVDDPKILPHWPADFRITADYHLAGKTLVTEYTIENPDTKPLPFGFGTHPYFRVPLGGTSAADCVVTVPVGDNWQLESLLPTGERNAPSFVADLARGMPMQAMTFDHVFSKLRFDNHRTTATVRDPQSRRTLSLSWDDQFPVCVVYNPKHREAVCIEPYSTVPDAFALGERKIETHLHTLAPGQSFRTRMEIALA